MNIKAFQNSAMFQIIMIGFLRMIKLKQTKKQSVRKFKTIISKMSINEIKHKYNVKLCLVFQVFWITCLVHFLWHDDQKLNIFYNKVFKNKTFLKNKRKRTCISVLRSAKRAPANVHRLSNRKWRQRYCLVGERSRALALLNAAQVSIYTCT